MHPGDRAAHLLGHRQEAATGLVHTDEVEHDEVRARRNQHLGRQGKILRRALAPCPAMDEHIDRGVGLVSGIEVEPLDRGRPVGEPPRRPDAGAHRLAVRRVALEHLVAVRRVPDLVVGVVQLLLVHVEPHQRPLLARRRRGCVAAFCDMSFMALPSRPGGTPPPGISPVPCRSLNQNASRANAPTQVGAQAIHAAGDLGTVESISELAAIARRSCPPCSMPGTGAVALLPLRPTRRRCHAQLFAPIAVAIMRSPPPALRGAELSSAPGHA